MLHGAPEGRPGPWLLAGGLASATQPIAASRSIDRSRGVSPRRQAQQQLPRATETALGNGALAAHKGTAAQAPAATGRLMAHTTKTNANRAADARKEAIVETMVSG